MNNSIYKGKVLNLYSLLESYKVEIPIIQRDYAQGRKDTTEIRINFLSALRDSILSESSIKLDFVYGSKADNVFLPLDGQQRLTTLFLLYWYALMKSGNFYPEHMKVLKKFTYETRITSRDFCESLVDNNFIIEDFSRPISESIINASWFFLSWKKDPTIDAMLRTLDDIHVTFCNVDGLWEKLYSKANVISFYFVELENIGLTDDLYIKMNARGKLLTSFESFKAGFEKYVRDRSWEKNKESTETFAFKIDTIWTDFFWSKFRKSNSVDEAFMRFIGAIAMIRLSIEKGSSDRFVAIRKLQENANSVRTDYFTFEGFKYLIDCFRIYTELENDKWDTSFDFPLWRHKPQTDILSEIVFVDNIHSQLQGNGASYTQKVLFFAQTEYLKRASEFDREKFCQWMRVVRNIVSRGDIDKDGNRPDVVRSPESFDGAINLIYELADGCGDIYSFLSENPSLKSAFTKDQIDEEKTKAKLIRYDEKYRKIIHELEDTELLRGKIQFVFDCVEFAHNQSLAHLDYELLVQVRGVLIRYFAIEAEISNDLRRALLCIEVDGAYEFYNYWWSYWHVVGAEKRRLIDRFRELEYYVNSDFRRYFKKLVLALIQKSMAEIAKDFVAPAHMPNWKIRLIKEPNLLDQFKCSYIAISDNKERCYILKSKRPRDIDGSFEVS